MKQIDRELKRLANVQGLRELTVRRPALDFSSNDYLGLTDSAVVRSELCQALAGNSRQTGVALGATGSRLLSGNTAAHVRTESFLADTFGAPSALLMSSGYTANIGLLQALGNEQTEFFSDEFNHASLIDGMRLSPAKKTIFRHNDMDVLAGQLQNSTADRKIIVTESVFSMDGDLAPLDGLFDLAHRFDAWLVIDEAHATGVFGERGLGRVNHAVVHGASAMISQATSSAAGQATSSIARRTDVPVITVHTASKALGAQGAFILGPDSVKQYLINKSRALMYSTALSPILCAQIEIAMREVIRLAQSKAGERLLQHAERVRFSLRAHFELTHSQSQIIPVLLGSNERAVHIATQLQARGFDVRAIRSPTVPKGTERVRITLKSTHSPEDTDQLIQAMVRLS